MIVDRIEGNEIIIEIEKGEIIKVPKSLFPSVKEGDVININKSEGTKEQLEREITKKMNDLFVD